MVLTGKSVVQTGKSVCGTHKEVCLWYTQGSLFVVHTGRPVAATNGKAWSEADEGE